MEIKVSEVSQYRTATYSNLTADLDHPVTLNPDSVAFIYEDRGAPPSVLTVKSIDRPDIWVFKESPQGDLVKLMKEAEVELVTFPCGKRSVAHVNPSLVSDARAPETQGWKQAIIQKFEPQTEIVSAFNLRTITVCGHPRRVRKTLRAANPLLPPRFG
jgi:hypothetical protein